MKWTRIAACLLLAMLLASPVFLNANASMIVHAKPVKLTHLSGTIVDMMGNVVDFAKVELLDPADHHVIESTFADGNGKFNFNDRKHGERLEIQVWRMGFNITRYNIEIVRFGKSHMRVVLNVAS